MEVKKTLSKSKKAEKREVKALKKVSKLLPGLGKLLGVFAKPVIKVSRKGIENAPNIPGVKQVKQVRGIQSKSEKSKVKESVNTYEEHSKSGGVKFSSSSKHSKIDFKKFVEISPTAADLLKKTKAMKSNIKSNMKSKMKPREIKVAAPKQRRQ